MNSETKGDDWMQSTTLKELFQRIAALEQKLSGSKSDGATTPETDAGVTIPVTTETVAPAGTPPAAAPAPPRVPDPGPADVPRTPSYREPNPRTLDEVRDRSRRRYELAVDL